MSAAIIEEEQTNASASRAYRQTDGAPALTLGVDPAQPGVMRRPPRPRCEGVITRRMWAGIFFVGAVMAAGTLFVLDASLPGASSKARAISLTRRRWRSRP